MPKEYIAALNILVNDREVNAPEINEIITKNGRLVLARLGMHLSRKCVKNCSGLITLIVEGEKKELEKLAKDFSKYKFTVVKLCFISEVK